MATTGRLTMKENHLNYVRSLDHVGVIVDDLEAATEFLLDLERGTPQLRDFGPTILGA